MGLAWLFCFTPAYFGWRLGVYLFDVRQFK